MRPIRSSKTRTSRISPTPPKGRYPQLLLCGHAGNAPNKAKTRITINIIPSNLRPSCSRLQPKQFESPSGHFEAARALQFGFYRPPVVTFAVLPMASPDTTSSTLRFSCRPLALSFEATGMVFPKPLALTDPAVTPCCTR